MRTLSRSLFLFISFATLLVSAHAQADCLSMVKTKLLTMPPAPPAEVLSQMNITAKDYSCLAKKEVSFDKNSLDSKYSKVSSLNYDFEMSTANGNKLETSFSFYATAESSSAAAFELGIEYSIDDKNANRVYVFSQNFVYDKNCRATLSATEKIYYKKLPNGEVEVTTVNRNANASEVRDTVVWSREAAESDAALNSLDSLAQAIRFADGKTHKIIGDDGRDTYFLIEILPPVNGFNLLRRRYEAMPGIRMKVTDSQQQLIVLMDYRYTKDESFFTRSGTSFDGTKNFSQQIGEAEWFRLGLNVSASEQSTPQMIGFTDNDWSRPTLSMNIETKTPFKPYENSSAYFDVKPASTSTLLSITTTDRKIPQNILAWNAPNSAHDQPYLATTKFINPKAVATQVDTLRPQLVGKNRLEAAVIILESISKILVKYDQNALELGLISMQSTEDILRNRTGVCQHYAALFVAMARQLGIPARVVSGYSLHTTTVAAHAWVELKINDKICWPLEPQLLLNRLPSRGYLPVGIMIPYEAPINNPKLESELNWQYVRRATSLNFAKITRANP